MQGDLTNINLSELLKAVNSESEELNEQVAKFLKVLLYLRPDQNDVADLIIGFLGHIGNLDEKFDEIFAPLVSSLAILKPEYVLQAMQLLSLESFESIIGKELEGACSCLVMGICMTN